MDTTTLDEFEDQLTETYGTVTLFGRVTAPVGPLLRAWDPELFMQMYRDHCEWEHLFAIRE